MMEPRPLPTHTPGPWKIFDGWGASKDRPIIVDSIPDVDGKCVANCICYIATTNAQFAANAALIAQAPELLAQVAELQHDNHTAAMMLQRRDARVEELERMLTIDGIEDLIKTRDRLRELLREARNYITTDCELAISIDKELGK